MSNVFHPYHLVDPSPWPYVASCGAFFLTFGSVIYFHYSFVWIMALGLSLFTITFILWCRDVVREATFQGHHTEIVKRGLKMGMLLFIVSEICFFVSFF